MPLNYTDEINRSEVYRHFARKLHRLPNRQAVFKAHLEQLIAKLGHGHARKVLLPGKWAFTPNDRISEPVVVIFEFHCRVEDVIAEQMQRVLAGGEPYSIEEMQDKMAALGYWLRGTLTSLALDIQNITDLEQRNQLIEQLFVKEVGSAGLFDPIENQINAYFKKYEKAQDGGGDRIGEFLLKKAEGRTSPSEEVELQRYFVEKQPRYRLVEMRKINNKKQKLKAEQRKLGAGDSHGRAATTEIDDNYVPPPAEEVTNDDLERFNLRKPTGAGKPVKTRLKTRRWAKKRDPLEIERLVNSLDVEAAIEALKAYYKDAYSRQDQIKNSSTICEFVLRNGRRPRKSECGELGVSYRTVDRWLTEHEQNQQIRAILKTFN